MEQEVKLASLELHTRLNSPEFFLVGALLVWDVDQRKLFTKFPTWCLCSSALCEVLNAITF